MAEVPTFDAGFSRVNVTQTRSFDPVEARSIAAASREAANFFNVSLAVADKRRREREEFEAEEIDAQIEMAEKFPDAQDNAELAFEATTEITLDNALQSIEESSPADPADVSQRSTSVINEMTAKMPPESRESFQVLAQVKQATVTKRVAENNQIAVREAAKATSEQAMKVLEKDAGVAAEGITTIDKNAQFASVAKFEAIVAKATHLTPTQKRLKVEKFRENISINVAMNLIKGRPDRLNFAIKVAEGRTGVPEIDTASQGTKSKMINRLQQIISLEQQQRSLNKEAQNEARKKRMAGHYKTVLQDKRSNGTLTNTGTASLDALEANAETPAEVLAVQRLREQATKVEQESDLATKNRLNEIIERGFFTQTIEGEVVEVEFNTEELDSIYGNPNTKINSKDYLDMYDKIQARQNELLKGPEWKLGVSELDGAFPGVMGKLSTKDQRRVNLMRARGDSPEKIARLFSAAATPQQKAEDSIRQNILNQLTREAIAGDFTTQESMRQRRIELIQTARGIILQEGTAQGEAIPQDILRAQVALRQNPQPTATFQADVYREDLKKLRKDIASGALPKRQALKIIALLWDDKAARDMFESLRRKKGAK